MGEEGGGGEGEERRVGMICMSCYYLHTTYTIALNFLFVEI